MKKIIFMGTPQFSTAILSMLVDSGYQVLAVVTQPDKPVGRKKVLTPSPVKVLALDYDIPVYQPEKLSGSKELEELMALDADLIVTAAYGQFLPTKFLEFPKFGAVNVHASLLPKYRGGAPIHYAIMNGDKETGVTIMRMIAKMDAGDILSQKAIPIEEDDDVASMFDKLSVVGRDLLKETLPRLFAGQLQPIAQDPNLVTFSPNIQREEEQIDWSLSAQEVDYFVRGLRPWPSAHTVFEGIRYKLWQVKPLPQGNKSDLPIGSFYLDANNRLLVVCGNQSLLQILEIQPAGKGRLTDKEFTNGFKNLLQQKVVFDIPNRKVSDNNG